MYARHLAILCLFALAGCSGKQQAPSAYEPPPGGQGHYEADDGNEYTVFKNIGVIQYSETKTPNLMTGQLTGYTFAAAEDDQPEVLLEARARATYSVAIYGPRASDGLWGRPLLETHGNAPIRVTGWTAPRSGTYFILLRVFERTNVATRVTLTCEGCPEPECAAAPACDLYCPNGLETNDEDGCFECWHHL